MQLEYIGRYLIYKIVLNISTNNNRYDITDKKFLYMPFLRCIIYIIRNSTNTFERVFFFTHYGLRTMETKLLNGDTLNTFCFINRRNCRLLNIKK